MEMVKAILERPNTNINATNDNGRTALHIAAITDNRDCIERLVDHRKRGILRFVTTRVKTECEMVDCNSKDANGDTPLMLAVKKDSSEAANIILSKLKSMSLGPTIEWRDIWSSCISSKMKKVLEKHYQADNEFVGDDLSDLYNSISHQRKVILKLPNTFGYLISLLVDKLQATFPSQLIFISKLAKPGFLFNKMKVKEDAKERDTRESTKLDSGVELNYTDLIKDVLFIQEICCSKKKDGCHNFYGNTKPMNFDCAFDYVRKVVRRKVPL